MLYFSYRNIKMLFMSLAFVATGLLASGEERSDVPYTAELNRELSPKKQPLKKCRALSFGRKVDSKKSPGQEPQKTDEETPSPFVQSMSFDIFEHLVKNMIASHNIETFDNLSSVVNEIIKLSLLNKQICFYYDELIGLIKRSCPFELLTNRQYIFWYVLNQMGERPAEFYFALFQEAIAKKDSVAAECFFVKIPQLRRDGFLGRQFALNIKRQFALNIKRNYAFVDYIDDVKHILYAVKSDRRIFVEILHIVPDYLMAQDKEFLELAFSVLKQDSMLFCKEILQGSGSDKSILAQMKELGCQDNVAHDHFLDLIFKEYKAALRRTEEEREMSDKEVNNSVSIFINLIKPIMPLLNLACKNNDKDYLERLISRINDLWGNKRAKNVMFQVFMRDMASYGEKPIMPYWTAVENGSYSTLCLLNNNMDDNKTRGIKKFLFLGILKACCLYYKVKSLFS